MKVRIPIAANCDAVQLCRAAVWLGQSGAMPQTRNELLRACVQLVAEQLEGPEPTLEEAHRFLDEKLPVQTVQAGKKLTQKLARVKLERPQAEAEEQREYEKARALAEEFGQSLTLEEFRENRRSAK